MSSALVPTISQGMVDLQAQAELAFKSGVYRDLVNKDQAFLRMQMAIELGLKPTLALRGLYLSKSGAVGFSAELLKTLVQKSGEWRWKVIQKDIKGCVLEWEQKEDGKWNSVGKSSFTIEDANRAGLNGDNWKKFPEDMCFARAVTRGIRTYCPSVTGGIAAYDIEEVKAFDKPDPKIPQRKTEALPEPIHEDPEVIDASFKVVEDPVPSDKELEDLIRKAGADRVVMLRTIGGSSQKMADLNPAQRAKLKSFLLANPKVGG